jgi:hypothetical protein
VGQAEHRRLARFSLGWFFFLLLVLALLTGVWNVRTGNDVGFWQRGHAFLGLLWLAIAAFCLDRHWRARGLPPSPADGGPSRRTRLRPRRLVGDDQVVGGQGVALQRVDQIGQRRLLVERQALDQGEDLEVIVVHAVPDRRPGPNQPIVPLSLTPWVAPPIRPRLASFGRPSGRLVASPGMFQISQCTNGSSRGASGSSTMMA